MTILEKFVRTLKFVAMVSVALFIFVGCGDDCEKPNQPTDDENSNWIPILIQQISTECDYLDSIFVPKNLLLRQMLDVNGAAVHIINSKEELDAINPFDFDVDCIDFSQYTLIGGYFLTPHSPSVINNIFLIERKNNYFLDAYMYDGGFTMPGTAHFWRLYPKLKANKNVIANRFFIN